jgi:hypothetical protein
VLIFVTLDRADLQRYADTIIWFFRDVTMAESTGEEGGKPG